MDLTLIREYQRLKSHSKMKVKINNQQFGILLFLIISTAIVVTLSLLLAKGPVDDGGDFIIEADDPYVPPANVLYLPLESNLTNLVDQASYTLVGTYQPVCEPEFANGSVPSGDFGDFLYFPCSLQDSKIDTGISLPASFSLSAWVGTENDTYTNLFKATNFDVSIANDKIRLNGNEFAQISYTQWTFVGIEYTSLNYRLYLNRNYTNVTDVSAPTGTLSLVNSLFNGKLSQVRMWNYAITVDRMYDLYDTTTVDIYT